MKRNNMNPDIARRIAVAQQKKPARNHNIQVPPLPKMAKQARFNYRNMYGTKAPPVNLAPRPTSSLTTLLNKYTKLSLPHEGAFNAGLVPFKDEFICVYRPNEHQFIGCILDKDLKLKLKSIYHFQLSNCADPRLIWTPDNKLLTTYSSYDPKVAQEYISGSILMDRNISDNFINGGHSFRISSKSLAGRQKNWMPFVCDGQMYIIASTCPHIVYKLEETTNGYQTTDKWETNFVSPWFFKNFLRGNTNAVQLEDGNFLGTFHTVEQRRDEFFYDNGCYVFEGKPPFKVLRCANRTYLPAEAAIEPFFRKAGQIRVCFPVGMVRTGNKLLISYGDNDSCVKIMETTVEQMLETTLEVL